MKRKLACFLCVLLCLCALLPSAAGAGTMYSMSVNDKLLEYSADTMPIVYDGAVYVPYTVFISRQNGGVEFGIFHSWNKKVNIFSLYSKEKPLLSFDIEAGTAYDMQDNVYPYKAIVRNGTVFLPAQKICNYFGLQYSAVTHAYGTLVRVKRDGDYYLSDVFLISAADQRLKDQKDSYDKEQQAVVPVVTPTPTPVVPEVTEPNQIELYFAFRCDEGENVGRVQAALEGVGAKGIFYFRPDGLASRDDEIRRLLAAGHRIGFWTEGETAELCLAQAAEGNRLLKHIAWARTDFLLVEQEAAAKELAGEGWVCWNGNVNGVPNENVTAATAAANIRRSIEKKQDVARVLMNTDDISAAALERLLPWLTGNRYIWKTVTEVTG